MNKSTLIWAALVSALAGYVIYDYRHAPREVMEAGESKAFSVAREDVTGFEMTRDGETIEVKKEGDDWVMLRPVKDDAEETAIDGFLFGLQNERFREFRDPDDKGAVDWAKFGLDQPKVTITIRSKGGEETFALSKTNAFDGSFYVRRGDQLLIGGTGLAQTTNRVAGAFRSRRIWRHADADVTKATAVYPNHASNFAVTKDGRGWHLEPAPKFPFDPTKADEWVNAVEDLTAVDFVREGVDDLKSYGLDRPVLKVTIDYQTPNEKPGRWTLTFGPERGKDVFFFTNDRAVILKAAASTVRKLLATAPFFRDGHQPFQYDVERARHVHVKTTALDLDIAKADGGWRLANAKSGESIDETELAELLTAVRGLKALDFPSGVAVKAAPTLEVKDTDGKTLFSLAIGDEYEPKAPWLAGTKLRAVRVGADTFGLPKAQIETLIKERLVKRAPKPAARPEAK